MARILAILAMFLACAQIGFLDAPASAQRGPFDHASAQIVSVESWVEEWDPALGRWVRVADDAADPDPAHDELPTITTTIINDHVVGETRAGSSTGPRQAARFAPSLDHGRLNDPVARYGPFVVVSDKRAVLAGATDTRTPRQFAAMLRDFPALATLEMIEAPGTNDDLANLEVGRMIRAAGIATHVPRGGSVRSGAVELFLAGTLRSVEPGARFAVHSWRDSSGREAADFAPDHSAHRLYLDYYKDMGMNAARARDFYAMTNSVPHAEALWLDADEMRAWLAPDTLAPATAVPPIAIDDAAVPVLTYRDLSAVSIARLDLARLDSQPVFP